MPPVYPVHPAAARLVLVANLVALHAQHGVDVVKGQRATGVRGEEVRRLEDVLDLAAVEIEAGEASDVVEREGMAVSGAAVAAVPAVVTVEEARPDGCPRLGP